MLQPYEFLSSIVATRQRDFLHIHCECRAGIFIRFKQMTNIFTMKMLLFGLLVANYQA